MFDYAIKNGLIVDGTRQGAYRATVYLKNGAIKEINSDDSLPSQKTIDATGKVVAPGFIDLHTHSDVAVFCGPNFESAVYQGVTFHMVGNCGFSVVPNSPRTHNTLFKNRSSLYYVDSLSGDETTAHDVASYGATIRKRTVPIHVGIMVGHGTIRGEVLGDQNREPTTAELEQMKRTLDKSLDQGAFGMSLGLIYRPGMYSRTDELIELARVLKQRDAVLAVHMRSESAHVFEALEEMLTVARQTNVKLHISHLKLMWKPQWGKANDLLHLIDVGQSEGLQITADQYPYCASSTGLGSLLPDFAKHGTSEQFLARFDDPMTYEQIRREVAKSIERRGGPETTTVANTRGQLPEADGKHLGELAEMWGVSPSDAYCRVIRNCGGRASAVYHAMSLPDVLEIMRRLDVSVGSDGYAHDFLSAPILGRPHPRSVGTFPRYLQTVREHNLLSVEDAVYKITGLPAKIAGLSARTGAIKPGMLGDVTVFDWTTVEDCATFKTPSLKPRGIEHVFVAGKPVLLDGVQTTERNGRFWVR